MAEKPEVWLRGTVDGFDPLVMPVVHSLLQAREDIERLAATVPPEHVWRTPGGAASIGFHVRHLGGALDRLLTYARGEMLNDAQKAAAKAECDDHPHLDGAALAARVTAAIETAIDQLRATDTATLTHERKVGRAGLPTTVSGALFHGAEHTARHAGQFISTVKLLSAGL